MSLRICCLSGVLLLAGQAVLADVQVVAEDDGRMTVIAEQASNRAILETLGRELEFEIFLEDADWGEEPREFERTDTPEKVLKALLGGTNHLLSYRGDEVSGVTVLPPGAKVSSFFSPTPLPVEGNAAQDAEPSAATAGVAMPGDPRRMSDPAGSRDRRDYAAGEDADAEEDREARDARLAATRVNDLLRNRALVQTSPSAMAGDTTGGEPGTAPTTSTPSSAQAPSGIPAGIDQAELARITRQAHQDVQNVAEMLRRTEAQMQRTPPE